MLISPTSIYSLEELPALVQTEDWVAVTSAIAAFSGDIFQNDEEGKLYDLFISILSNKNADCIAIEAVIDRISFVFDEHKHDEKLIELICYHAIHLNEDDEDNRWVNRKSINIILANKDVFHCIDTIMNINDEIIREHIYD